MWGLIKSCHTVLKLVDKIFCIEFIKFLKNFQRKATFLWHQRKPKLRAKFVLPFCRLGSANFPPMLWHIFNLMMANFYNAYLVKFCPSNYYKVLKNINIYLILPHIWYELNLLLLKVNNLTTVFHCTWFRWAKVQSCIKTIQLLKHDVFSLNLITFNLVKKCIFKCNEKKQNMTD